MQAVTTYTTEQLIEQLKAKDEHAFRYLYDHYSKALFNIILRITPEKDIAEDILQEGFLKIWQNLTSYDETKGRLFTWMLSIVRNLAIDRTRSKDFKKQYKTVGITENVYTNEKVVNSNIADYGFNALINKLSEESRKLLELSFYQGYTHEEISKMMNIPLGTVKTRIRTTIIELRKLMNDK
ncbi:MAG: sigma-70 family RNA polymerase sigma factor [Chitinophagaceae bacterium]|nr:sigma-70 family RNA polymerase sigma factor [Chitinophagaceae bacterium]